VLRDFANYALNVGLSGWLSAVLFGVVFSIAASEINERRKLRTAKNTLRQELIYNLKYLSYIYQKECRGADNFVREMHYAPISLFESYAQIIIEHYPHVSSRLIWLFSAFKEIGSTGEIISHVEDMNEFFKCAKVINTELKLGIKDEDIQEISFGRH
jgi:hypothetical protein